MAAGFLASALHASEPQRELFQPLTDLGGGRAESVAHDISADGSVVVGSCHGELGSTACRWVDGEPHALDVPGTHSIAIAISPDGRWIAGSTHVEGKTRGFLSRDGKTELVSGSPESVLTQVWDVNDSGDIGGDTRVGRESLGFVRLDGKISLHPDTSSIVSLSADGSILAAKSRANSALRLVNNEREPAAALTGGTDYLDLKSMTPRGDVLVGLSDSMLGHEAFRWHQSATAGLGGLSDHHELFSMANALSADGAVIVGTSENAQDQSEAFVWDERNGLRSLTQVLTGHGADLSGWHLQSATAISADGRVVVGFGSSTCCSRQAWMARLPESAVRGHVLDPAIVAGNSWLIHDRDLDSIRPPTDLVPLVGGRLLAVTEYGLDFFEASGKRATHLAVDGGPVSVARHRDQWFVLDRSGQVLVGQETSIEAQVRISIEDLTPTLIAASSDRWFLADSINNRIAITDQAGAVLSQFGARGSEPGQFLSPVAMAVMDGELYVLDAFNYRVQVFDLNGEWRRGWGGRGRFPGLFVDPSDLAVYDNQIYVLDAATERVQVFDRDGRFNNWWGERAIVPGEGAGRFREPRHLAISGDAVVVCEPREMRCQRLRKSLNAGASIHPATPRASRSSPGPFIAVGDGVVAMSRPVDATADLVRLSDGTHLGRVGEWGHGAGQLLEAGDLTLVEDLVWIADSVARRLVSYRLEANGQSRFIQSLDLKSVIPNHFMVAEDGTLIVLDREQAQLAAWSPDLTPLRAVSMADVRGARDIGLRGTEILVLGQSKIHRFDAAGGKSMDAPIQLPGCGAERPDWRGAPGESVATSFWAAPRFLPFGLLDPRIYASLRPRMTEVGGGASLGPRMTVVGGGALLRRGMTLGEGVFLSKSEPDWRRSSDEIPATSISAAPRFLPFGLLDPRIYASLRPRMTGVGGGASLRPRMTLVGGGAALRPRMTVVGETASLRPGMTEVGGGTLLRPGMTAVGGGASLRPGMTLGEASKDIKAEPTQSSDDAGRHCQWSGMAVGKDLIYLSDPANDRVVAVNDSGEVVSTHQASGLGAGQLRQPRGLAYGPAGLAIADYGNRRGQVLGLDSDGLTTSSKMVFGEALYVAPTRSTPDIVSTVTSVPPPNDGLSRVVEPEDDEWVSNAGTYRVTVDIDQGGLTTDLFSFGLQIVDSGTGQPIGEHVRVGVTAVMPAHRHGMLTQTVVERSTDRFVVRGMKFHMRGEWELRIDISDGPVAERAQMALTL